jgi:hypothetical protein
MAYVQPRLHIVEVTTQCDPDCDWSSRSHRVCDPSKRPSHYDTQGHKRDVTLVVTNPVFPSVYSLSARHRHCVWQSDVNPTAATTKQTHRPARLQASSRSRFLIPHCSDDTFLLDRQQCDCSTHRTLDFQSWLQTTRVLGLVCRRRSTPSISRRRLPSSGCAGQQHRHAR